LRPTARQAFLLLGVHERSDAGHDANSMTSAAVVLSYKCQS